MTATEWLFEQINNILIDYTEGRISALVYGVKLTEFKYKAKEMEREQQERVVNMALLNTTSSQTEISDEEIEEQANKYVYDDHVLFVTSALNQKRYGFADGAKWYREQLKKK